MVRHPRGIYISLLPSSDVATPENKLIHSTLPSICKKVRLKTRLFAGCSPPFMRLAEHTSRRFARGASSVCVVGGNPACSAPALYARIYDGHTTTAMLDFSTPPVPTWAGGVGGRAAASRCPDICIYIFVVGGWLEVGWGSGIWDRGLSFSLEPHANNVV